MSMRRSLLGFGAFAVVSLLVTAVMWNTLTRSLPGASASYTATFTDVLGLRPGDDVRIAGVRVGKVTKVGLDSGNRARVTFLVQREQTVYGDTKAMIRYQNLIGQRFIALAPGGKGEHRPLRPGGAIPVERTEPSFDLSGLFNGFQPLLDVLRPEQVNELTGTLLLALQGDGVSLSAFITQAVTVAGDFQRRDAILSEVIANLAGVVQGLAHRGDELNTLVTQTKEVISGLYAQGQSLEASTARLATATTSLTQLLGMTRPPLATAQDATHEALSVLIANGAKLDRAAVDLPAILADIGKATQDGAYTSAYLCSLDISLYGVLLPRGLISQIGGDSRTAVCRP